MPDNIIPIRPEERAIRLKDLKACHMSLYPTAGSLQEAIETIEAKLPITSDSDLFPLLMMLQNTIIKELEDAAK